MQCPRVCPVARARKCVTRTYDPSRTLQENAGAGGGAKGSPCSRKGGRGGGGGADAAAAGGGEAGLRDKFVWSHYLMLPVLPKLRDGSWLVPLVHGFFRQCSLALCGRLITLTLLARRSRLFAGARLLKRGLCAAGHVANEVETEQVVADGSCGALHARCRNAASPCIAPCRTQCREGARPQADALGSATAESRTPARKFAPAALALTRHCAPPPSHAHPPLVTSGVLPVAVCS